MKNIFTIICFLSIGTLSFAQTQTPTTNPTVPVTGGSVETGVTKPDPNAPVFKFEIETYDFGDIPQGTPVSYTFNFSNTGKSPLVIADVYKSCGCTTPEWSDAPVLPGQKGFIKATYNAEKTGSFMKSLTISSNASEPNKVIYIKGNVLAPTTTTPTETPKN